MAHLRHRRNILLQLFALTLVLVIWASGCSAISSPRKLSHAELRSAFCLKERFKRAVDLDSGVLHSRQKRFIHFRFKLPFGSNMEIKWAINWVVPSEVKYFTRLQIALPINRALPTYLVDDQYQPPFATLFGTKFGRKDPESDDYYDEEESPEIRSENEDSGAEYQEGEETESKAEENEAENLGVEVEEQEIKFKDEKNRHQGNKDEPQKTDPKAQKAELGNKDGERENKKTESKQQTGTFRSDHTKASVKSNEGNATENNEGSSRKRRSNHVTDRKDAYEAIEDILTRQGLPAHACLLRTICEVAAAPLHYGIIGDFLNLLLTPSAASLSAPSEDLAELSGYLDAEAAGRQPEEECHRNFAGCPSSLFDVVPLIRHKILDFGAF